MCGRTGIDWAGLGRPPARALCDENWQSWARKPLQGEQKQQKNTAPCAERHELLAPDLLVNILGCRAVPHKQVHAPLPGTRPPVCSRALQLTSSSCSWAKSSKASVLHFFPLSFHFFSSNRKVRKEDAMAPCRVLLTVCCLTGTTWLCTGEATAPSLLSMPASSSSPTFLLRLRGGSPPAAPRPAKSGGLFAAAITRWQHDDIMQTEAVHLAYFVNTTAVSWMGRGTVKEVMALVMRKCVDSTQGGDFARVEHELQGKKAFCFVVSRKNGLAATCMTNSEYPERVAINFLDMLLDEFTQIFGNEISQASHDECMDFPELQERMADFQDPSSADAVERIKKDMYESERVLQKNVEAILERGQKLEDLIQQSEQLSMQTKLMYKSVNKNPGWFEDCCGIV